MALTRLQLAKKMGRWSGTVLPSDITDTVTPDTDEIADLVEFVDQAWIDIQLAQNSRWNWMRHRVNDTVALVASTRTLALSAIDATCRKVIPFIEGDTYPQLYILLKHPTSGAIHKAILHEYSQFRGYLDRGDRPEGRPVRFTVHPDGTLEFDPTPDVAYTLSLDWMHEPNELSVDADTPDMPDHFHMLVVWWALVHLFDFEEKGGRYQTANRQYSRMYNRLCIEQLPPASHAEYLSTAELYSW